MLVELESQLGYNDVTIELNDDARTLLADRGYERAMGARQWRA